MRVNRKVKIDGKWVMAPVRLDGQGRPEAKHVWWKGQRIEVSGGTFYLDTGHGKSRRQVPCGIDPESVKRAMRTQRYVLELRRSGMDVEDAPEILRHGMETLKGLAKAFKEHPPSGYSAKTVSKYRNALEDFAGWSASVGVIVVTEVNKKVVARWVTQLQKDGLDASTIGDKVRIVLAELKREGNEVRLERRSLPRKVKRLRSCYAAADLEVLFARCTLEEYEMFQTFVQTGMREMEVAFFAYSDVDAVSSCVRVTSKPELGFTPKGHHERSIPVPRWFVQMLQARKARTEAAPAELVFATSRRHTGRGNQGGGPDKNMLEKLKQVARREGMNCGECMGQQDRKAVSCRTHPVCRRWGLHKFRHTFATFLLRDKVDIASVRRRLGHKDIETTMVYLHELEVEEAQAQAETSTLATQFMGEAPAAGVARRSIRLDRGVARASRSRG